MTFTANGKNETDLKQISLYFLSLPRIRIIVLTCPENINVVLIQVCKKSAEIMRACKIAQITMMRSLRATQAITGNDARPILFPLNSSLPFILFLFE